MNGRAIVLQGDARALPLPDASVDLIVTSPPFYQLRSYTDGGQHYAGQVGDEPTPQEYIAALLDCTQEWVRVLKSTGSMFVELGDKYVADNRGSGVDAKRGAAKYAPAGPQGFRGRETARQKSLMDLPHRYAIRCVDDLHLIKRAEIIWHHVNGLPESTNDRVRRAHSVIFHFTRLPRYYAAIDEVREPQAGVTGGKDRRPFASGNGLTHRSGNKDYDLYNPLGKLPGSVWNIPSAPLQVPAHLGIDHFAAFPPALVRPLVLGWSPPGICTTCGEGRRPVVDKRLVNVYHDKPTQASHYIGSEPAHRNGRKREDDPMMRAYGSTAATITGYVCACTPYTDHPGTGSSGEGYNRPGEGINAGRRITFPDTPGPPSRLSTRPHVGGGREYHLDSWQPPPTRPAVVLDPFSGTGTSPLVASVYGRIGIGVDRSADYTRLAQWRTRDPGERARALGVPKPPPIPDGQHALFDL